MDFPLPPVGEGLYEVELIRWLITPGTAVGRGTPLMEVMSDKATMEVPAPFAGTVTDLLAEPGVKIQVGQPILRYESGTANGDHSPPIPEPVKVAAAPVTDSPVASAPAPTPRAAPKPAGDRLPAAAPSVRHLARKLGIDLSRVRGTGPAGRILLEDLAASITPRSTVEQPAKALGTADASQLHFGTAGTRMKLLGLRRKIAEHMIAAKRSIPHYSYIDECDLSDLVRLRSQLRETFGKAGVRLTYLPFFLKAAARALKEVPIVNSTFVEADQEIVLHDQYNIGIAVAAPNGLVVPVVKDADKKDVAAIATEIDRLSSEARAGRPRVEDMRGGTFTITSIGGIGGLISTPIINHPEVGIMGVGKVVKRPVYDSNGRLRPADIVFLSFSFDHRIVDGAVGAAFGNAVIRHLQNPASLLLPDRFGG